jgi:hypothetical protein
MSSSVNYKETAEVIIKLYDQAQENATAPIEKFLAGEFESFSKEQKVDMVEQLAGEFEHTWTDSSSRPEIEDEVLSKVFSLLLGRKVAHEDLSSTELLRRLAESLNTIFDSLNQLVDVINQHLYREYPGEETIRSVIGFQMTGDIHGKPLESYLGQIKKSFLVAQQAFRKSAKATLSKVLNELDPDSFADDVGGGFKFGPLKKAEIFEVYEDKFKQVRKWFDSGRFMEDFLREFEKACEKMLTR